MKIISLTDNGIHTVTAKAYINADKKHYNIIHGTKGFWEYRLGVIDSYAKPESIDDELVLDKTDYAIKPVISRTTNDYYKDARDNNVYNVALGHSDVNNDCLALWTIPNKRYTDVKYECKGMCDVLAVAENGIERPNIKYISPAPVVEIYGSCELIWTAKRADGKAIKQVITYDYKNSNFNIGIIEIAE